MVFCFKNDIIEPVKAIFFVRFSNYPQFFFSFKQILVASMIEMSFELQ